MTIDEAIKICEEDAEKIWGNPQSDRHAERCRQLAELLTELKEAKQLLKAAVEDMRWVNENTQDTDGTCVMRKGEGCGDCPLDINGDLWCKWKHEAEALKLIEKGENDER